DRPAAGAGGGDGRVGGAAGAGQGGPGSDGRRAGGDHRAAATLPPPRGGRAGLLGGGLVPGVDLPDPAAAERGRSVRLHRQPRLAAGDLLAPDRKSTRLNSSHVSISYAVFCLKKNS